MADADNSESLTQTTTSSHSSEDVGGSSPSRLLTIPQELRDQILAYVLVSSYFVIDVPRYVADDYLEQMSSYDDHEDPADPFNRLDFDDSDAEHSVSAYSALSATCRQLHQETKACFFGGNVFAACLLAGDHPPILPLCDGDLMRVKRFLLYRYAVAKSIWCAYTSVPATLEVRLKGTAIQTQITCGCDTLAESVLAVYPGGRISPRSREEDREAIVARTRTTIEDFKQAVQSHGKLTREVLNRLGESIIEAW